ncbi:hypothetical protein BDB00DRAFT_870864 [Zychaea mexicana]|uniref:uncharacterized protein n=1 Tax=Zychaea mexicana TaxID=64656 RepID=UPI0022FE3C72|nr:uncharacterized protein BDB00DRAFT_870864 [Zychaea mexicana]KAI9494866.1 hypothetical protein BDB00DRAFT_870864 [Zychaea mexicana]
MPPPMRHPGQKQIQRPLQAELAALNNLLTGGILEHAARILEHFAATQNSKLESESYDTPSFLTEKLLDKCNEFETVCDQTYYILEQSKRVLQLDWQQRTATQEDQAQQQRQQGQQQQQHQQESSQMHPAEDMGTDLSVTQNMDLTLDDMDDMDHGQQQQHQQAVEPMDEDDMDELLQLQRERLDRIRNVIVHGVDVEQLKDSQSGGKDDLLF